MRRGEINGWKAWLAAAVGLAIGAVFAAAAAFLLAGVILFVAEHMEVVALFVFAVWILWFGWSARSDMKADDADEEEAGEDEAYILYYNRTKEPTWREYHGSGESDRKKVG